MNEKFPSTGVTVPTVLLRLMKYSAAPLAKEKMLWTTGKAPGTSVGVRTMTGNAGNTAHVPAGNVTR
jgi:hypothetical protein